MFADLKDRLGQGVFSFSIWGMLGPVDLHSSVQRRERAVRGRRRGLTSAVKFGSIIVSFCTAE